MASNPDCNTEGRVEWTLKQELNLLDGQYAIQSKDAMICTHCGQLKRWCLQETAGTM